MDEPCQSWPFWKFGMKRDDLSTKLQDQYNTIPSSIQDPDAFHHDVYEISRLADTADEFHRLMRDRKEQRLKELNASLDLAAVEIIANPKLVGTAQWSHALQLFRSRSLDSLVRLFSSYLPNDYTTHQGYYSASSTGSSFSDRCSVRTASTNLSSLDEDGGPTFFHDDDEKPVMTHEPLSISTSISSSAITTELPPSPRSMTMQSETSTSSPIDIDHDEYVLHNLTPARTLSFSGSESGRFAGRVLQCLDDDDEEDTSQSEDPDSLTTSVSDLENRSTRESTVEEEQQPDYHYYPEHAVDDEDDCDDEFPTTQLPFDVFDDDVMESSETPTPKPETSSMPPAASYLDSKTYSSLRSIPTSFRSSSPKIPHHRRRDASPAKTSSSSSSSTMMSSRRSPEEASSRIQKPQPDAMRGARALAAKGRRRGLD
ncbi:hypothetical protein CGCSCA4_v005390 [Colletotrichum siamense]|uniref:Uncharacterized protein n=1 Tax=Colletotrichum siamense TaxID=690259 RepID=A0A9P5K328_COLSI|nr:hypothetical protein CGCSCA4_v005390 [Colletotrichum siamense]KAF4854830.1 hypothetical protein CGCSCA2_v009274 [Colletotrichum siamense]